MGRGEERPIRLLTLFYQKTAKPHALCREAPKEHVSSEVFVLNTNSNSIVPYLVLKLIH